MDREWSRKARATTAQKPCATSKLAYLARMERPTGMRSKSYGQAGAFDLAN